MKKLRPITWLTQKFWGHKDTKKNELKVPTDLLLFLGIIISLITYLNLNTLSKSNVITLET